MSGALRSASTLPGIVPFVSTFQSFMNGQMDTIRNIVTVVVTLGAIASWLAVIGIFGLRAFTVAQRTREFGIRMALGALGFDILRCVLGQYALPFGIGAVLGTALAAAVAKVVRNLLFGFIPFDLLTFGAGLLLFAAVAFAASIVPALRMIHRAFSATTGYQCCGIRPRKWSRSRRFMYPALQPPCPLCHLLNGS
jgi:ABC-type antimicrobial peptide transport system permease subunit